jgi:hypothetical protein
MKHKLLICGVCVLALLLCQVQPSDAGPANLISVNSTSGNCLTVIVASITMYVDSNNNDDGANHDWWGLVLSDGSGHEITYRSIYATVGYEGTSTLSIDFHFTSAPAFRPMTVRIYDNTLDSSSIADAKSGPLLDTIQFDPALFGVCTSIPVYTTAESVCPFADGRLNHCDAGQTVAVYCEKDGSVTALAIYANKGYPAFTVTPDEIAQVPIHPAKNTAIKSGNGATLYRLTSGEMQVNRAEDGTGKLYAFRFKDCPKP